MTPLPLCPSCQAPHDPSESICWMCGRKFWLGPGAAPAAPVKFEPRVPTPPPELAAPADPNPAPRDARPKPSAAPRAEPPAERSATLSAGWTQPLMIAAFIVILLGLVLGPGKGTALVWLGLAPAFFVTALTGFQQPKKMPDGFLPQVQYVVTKAASVVAIMILAGVAIALALAAACTAIVVGLSLHK